MNANGAAWPLPPPRWPLLGEGEVHVWRARLDPLAPLAPWLAQQLDDAERARAARFVREADRQRAVVTRAVLRTLAGHYVQNPAALVAFSIGSHGRPALCPQRHPGAPAFNLSHSGGLLLLAFAPAGTCLGIDLEAHRAMPDMAQLTRRFFAPDEARDLAAIEPEAARLAAFFDCWTRKEAVVKALGLGLTQSLAAFRVSVRPAEPAALLAWTGAPEEPRHWTLLPLQAAEDHSATLALRGAAPRQVQCWELAGLEQWACC